MTDFRARGTIMGPAGLTAVFGMGTGVAPPVWSPGIPPPGGEARRRRRVRWSVGHDESSVRFGHTPSGVMMGTPQFDPLSDR